MDRKDRNIAIGLGLAAGAGVLFLATRKASAASSPRAQPGPAQPPAPGRRWPSGLAANLPILRAAAARHGVPLNIMLAIAHHETGGRFDPYAANPSDGPRIHARYARSNPHIARGRYFNDHAARNDPQAWGSKGLMQMILATSILEGMPFDADWRTIFDPRVAADLGARRLKRTRRKFGSWPDAITAYNSGRPRSSAPAATLERYLPAVTRLAMGYDDA